MCKRGFLFNKGSLVSALEINNLPSRLKYIKSKDDLCDVNLNTNKKNRFPFCCPLTAKVLNGTNPFVLIWSCGCLMYEKLLFPLAGIKIKLETILQNRESTGDGAKEFTEKKYKCPNCRVGFALNSLFCLNLSTKKNNVKIITKKESKDNHQKDDIKLGKRNLMELVKITPVFKRIKFQTKRIKAGEQQGQSSVVKSQKSKKASENKKK